MTNEMKYTFFEPDYYSLSVRTYRRYHDQKGIFEFCIEGSTPEKKWAHTDPENKRSLAYVVNEWKEERGLNDVSTKIIFNNEGTPVRYRIEGTT